MRYERCPTHTPDHEAQETPPWRPEHGPRPRVTVYQHPHPMLWIYVQGQWRSANVHARHDYPSGTDYQVSIRLDGPRTPIHDPAEPTIRVYRWDPAVMRVQGIPDAAVR